MRNKILPLVSLLLLCLCPAQTSFAGQDMEERLDLAAKMHGIHPAAEQIDAAIDRVSGALPTGEKEAFRTAIRNALDYEALERHSIESMAKVFTLEELRAMVEFYSKPEAGNISAKLKEYNKLVEPVIFEMLDEAMMKARTGEAAK